MSWSSSLLSAPGGGAGGGGAGGGAGAAGMWASSLQAVPPATCSLNQPHLLHAFYKWSCREFSEPVKAPPAQVVPDVADILVSPSNKSAARGAIAEASLGGNVAAASARGSPATGPGVERGGSEVASKKPRKREEVKNPNQKLPPLQQRQKGLCRHDPVDSLSYEGALHLYLKGRNTRVREEAEALVKGYQTLGAPQEPEESLSNRVRRADLDTEEPPPRKLELALKKVLDLGHKRCASSLAFHPYEPLLVAADDMSTISVCNHEAEWTYGSFDNRNRPDSRVSHVSWINEANKSLLMTAAGDGVVRVWSGVMEAEASLDHAGQGTMQPPELVTGFQAIPDPRMGVNGPKMVTHWQQRRGLLSAAGKSRMLKAWDMASEQLWAEWEVSRDGAGTKVTALGAASDDDTGPLGVWMMAAGTSTGKILLFDERQRRAAGVIHDHGSWVADLHFTPGKCGVEIVSGCIDGWITVQDIRRVSEDGKYTTRVHSHSQLTCLEMHPRVPVLATGSVRSFVDIITPEGEVLSRIKQHNGFFDQSLGPVTTMSFHPNHLMLAAACLDYRVSIFTQEGAQAQAMDLPSAYHR